MTRSESSVWISVCTTPRSDTLGVDGAKVAEARVERTIPIRIALDEGLDVGLDSGTPVTLEYDVPFRYTGELAKVTIDLLGGPVEASAPK